MKNYRTKLKISEVKASPCLSGIKYPQFDLTPIECKSVYIFIAYVYDIRLTSTNAISVEKLLRKYYVNMFSNGFINNPSSVLLL
jgi:hypothetical protein